MQRTRSPARRQAPVRTGGSPAAARTPSSLVTGAAGRANIDTELKKTQQRSEQRKVASQAPRRFWMPPGTERDVIILDREPWAFRWEHALMNDETGRRDYFLPCIANVDQCPPCEADDHDSAYIMFLSVIDLESYEIKKGKNRGKVVPYSRKLMAVKSRQQGKFKRKYDAISAQGGDLRGMKVHLVRDDDRSPVIGNDIEFTGLRYSEAQLERLKEQYQDRKGATHVNNLGEVFNYAELFPAMNREELATALGQQTQPVPGSAAEAAQTDTPDVDGWDNAASGDNWEDDTQKPAQAAAAPARRAAPAAAAPVRRRAVVRRAAPAAPPATTGIPDDFDDDIPF